MKTKSPILNLSLLLILTSLLCGGIRDDVEKILFEQLGDSINVQYQQYHLPTKIKNEIQSEAKQKFFRDEINYWTIKSGTSQHFAFVDNTIGKSMPITFLVIFSEMGEIIHVQILKYREPYGGEISSPSWTSQFKGLLFNTKLTVGKNIDGISGATISVHSVTKGVHKLGLLLPYILNEQK